MAPGASQPPVPKPATGVMVACAASGTLATDAARVARRGTVKRFTGYLNEAFWFWKKGTERRPVPRIGASRLGTDVAQVEAK
jgi:hypothetical protein